MKININIINNIYEFTLITFKNQKMVRKKIKSNITPSKIIQIVLFLSFNNK